MRLLLSAAALAASAALALPADPLARYLGSARIVVASAPRSDDPALARQREAFASMGREASLRDLVLVEAVGESASARALRHALRLDAGAFAAALVGKDGEVKLRAARPLDAAALIPAIDAMPMRRQEKRERGE